MLLRQKQRLTDCGLEHRHLRQGAVKERCTNRFGLQRRLGSSAQELLAIGLSLVQTPG
jgi:hypothetical protein